MLSWPPTASVSYVVLLYFLAQNEDLPAPLRIQRVPTPQWAAAEDRKIRQELQRKHEVATSLKDLKDEHFSDFEGNLRVQKARTAALATRLSPPKGWGAQHTHVSVRRLTSMSTMKLGRRYFSKKFQLRYRWMRGHSLCRILFCFLLKTSLRLASCQRFPEKYAKIHSSSRAEL